MYVNTGLDDFDSAISAPPTKDALSFFAEQTQRMMSSVGEVFNPFYEQMATSLNQTYQNFVTSRPWELAQALERRTRHLFDHDDIRRLADLGSVQQAKSHMQRWIMACPEVRELYHEQKLDGYSDTYVDQEPTVIGGWAQYDYRRLMDGVVCVEDESWGYTNVYETLRDGDKPLTIGEVADILVTHENIKHLLATQAFDPTSKYNARR